MFIKADLTEVFHDTDHTTIAMETTAMRTYSGGERLGLAPNRRGQVEIYIHKTGWG